MDIEEAIRAILDGKAVLFVGAGFSRAAKDADGNAFLLGSELAQLLAMQSGLDIGVNLGDAADYFADEYGSDKLIELLRRRFTPKTITQQQSEIACLPWRRIYTTNYDNIVESSRRENGVEIYPVTLSAKIHDVPKSTPLCIHLNGYIDNLDRSTVLSELKLTDTSYVTASIQDSRWSKDFVFELDMAKAVFFVGFSLFDLDIRKLLRESTKLRNKCFFVIGNDVDLLTTKRLSPYGTLTSHTVDSFAVAINQVKTIYSPPLEQNDEYYSFEEIEYDGGKDRISDRDFLDLLLFGRYTVSQIRESILTGQKFFLKRSQLDNVVDIFDKATNQVVTITSMVGNGKSVFLDGAAIELARNGFRVFRLTKNTEYIDEEIKRLAQMGSNVVVQIDGYGKWIRQIEIFCNNMADRAFLLLSERSSQHDILVDRIGSFQKDGNYVFEIDLDRLDETELKWFSDVFDTYGVWGEHAGNSLRNKLKLLTQQCGRQIHAILVRLLDSPDIKQRLNAIGVQLQQNKTNFQLLITVFVLSSIGQQRISLDLIGSIWGFELLNRTNFRRDQTVRQFVDFQKDEVLFQSPVFAEYFLKNFCEPDDIVSVLISMYRQIDKYDLSRKFPRIREELVKFSTVQSVLPDKGLRHSAIAYYEHIKVIGKNVSDPLFWLQYAIACTTLKEIARARSYFDTAYSLARRRATFNEFQIDNHFARFLLVEAIEEMAKDEALNNFRRAHAIVRRQTQTQDRLRYPFKVALNYRTFFERFRHECTDLEIEEIRRCADFVEYRISLLKPGIAANHQIRQCRTDMKWILDEIRNDSKSNAEVAPLGEDSSGD